MIDIHAALGELLRVQRLRIELPAVARYADLGDLVHVDLPGIEITIRGDDEPSPGQLVIAYRSTAPCRLAQLADAVTVGTERAGGRGIPGSRPLVAADALDLWRDIATSASMWAVAVGIDRQRYLKPAAAARPRTADLMAADPVFRTLDTPPVGRLLRASATEADRRGLDAMVATIARQARRWAGEIDALFGATEGRSIRGVPCPDCWVDYIVEERDDGSYRVPALLLQFGYLEGVRLPYRWCRACDRWAWLDEPAE